MISPPATCGMCGSGGLALLHEFPESAIYRCSACCGGRTVSVSVIGPPQEGFDTERYAESREINAPYLLRTARARYRLLTSHGPGPYLVEVGCATGEFLRAASDRGHRVTGIEIAPRNVAYIARTMPGVDVRQAFLHDAGFEPGTVDVLAGFHVLEHIEDLDAFVGTVRELLRPGGIAFFVVPNLGSWYARVLGRRWWGFAPEHVWHFTREGLTRALEGMGLEVAESGSFEVPASSVWPMMPLIWGNLYHRIGNRVAPRGVGEGGDSRAGMSARRKLKAALLRAYHAYLFAASLALYPLSLLQNRLGGGYDLYVVARKK